MKKYLICILILLFSSPLWAAFSGPYSEEFFDCPSDYTHTACNLPSCLTSGGIFGCGQAASPCDGNYPGIDDSENYPPGDGTRAYFTYHGNAKNEWSHAFKVTISSSVTQLWMRWYMKAGTGLVRGFSDTFKNWYSQDERYFGWSGSSFVLVINGHPYGIPNGSTYGFDALGGDGDWHSYETYIRLGSNGQFRLWVDGNFVGEVNADMRSGSLGDIEFPSNHEFFGSSPCARLNFDAFAFATPSYTNLVEDADGRLMIGPIGWSPGSDTTAPVIGTTSPSTEQVCIDGNPQTTRIQATVTDATEPINCEYSLNEAFTFGTGTAMYPTDGGSGANFYADIASQACGNSYQYYMKCDDSAGTPNVSSAASIAYSIGTYAVDTTPPVIGSVSPTTNQSCDLQTIYARAVNVTDDSGQLDYVKISTINDFDPLTQGFNMGASGTGTSGENWSYAITPSCGTSTTYYMKAVDLAGNISAQATVTITVDPQQAVSLIFEEDFEDSSFASRGWVDGTPSSASITSGGQDGNCAIFTFAQSATSPTSTEWQTIRYAFTATDELQISWYSYFDNNWVGSGALYHPHEFYILSNEDGLYDALGWSVGNLYIEPGNPTNGLTPAIQYQDGKNTIYTSTPPNSLGDGTEGSVNYCNGYQSGQDQGQIQICYDAGTNNWYSATYWQGSQNFVRNTWQLNTVYIKMNSIDNGTAVPDAILYYWLDGELIIEKENIILRTGEYPNLMFDTFVIAPYIGDGSPATQTMRIDQLKVHNGLTSQNIVTVPRGRGVGGRFSMGGD